MQQQDEPVRLFVSYAWTSPTHESWVLSLATRLLEDGVEVVLDKWDLKPGHDANQFMEKMATDPSVSKVLMVCDRNYAEKADGRSGGVGIESQIISPAIYASGSQDKYAAAITEVDDHGRAYVPVFYKGRIYFDFSQAEHYEREYESLLRWILGKPLHVKPKLGSVPKHIQSPPELTTASGSRVRRAEEAIKQGSRAARALTRDYVESFVVELGEAGKTSPHGGVWDEKVVDAYERMHPYVSQFQELVRTVARYSEGSELLDELLDGIETCGALMFRPPAMQSWSENWFDHYKLILWELFLSTVAVLLKERRFDLALGAVQRAYFIPNSENGDRRTADYTIFFNPVATLRDRNRRLGANRVVPEADILAEKYKGSTLSLLDLMQADFVLYLRSVVLMTEFTRWYPLTLALADRHRPFEVFARSESRAYFTKLAPMLAVPKIEDFRDVLRRVIEAKELKFGGWPIDVGRLANAENLGLTT